jgi:TolB-like protein/Flp pilus assembly protein TadD
MTVIRFEVVSILEQLRRRNVLRVGAAYAVAAWLLIQVTETIFPLFGFDDTPARVVVIMLAIGFVPALLLAWVFEWTPDGFQRDFGAGEQRTEAGKNLDRWIIAGLALALVYFAVDKWLLEPGRAAMEREQVAAQVEEARQEGRSEALVESYGGKSIGVLPFVNMSSDAEQDYFSDGIAEEILNVLAQIPELRVVSRSSSFAYKDQALETPELARLLKVAYVLEGSVRKSGNKVRVTAQLIEARSDTHLWSQTWDREFKDIFTIQDEIAANVAENLQLTLTGRHTATDVEPRAYELVLRGRHLLYELSPGQAQRAETVFKEAITIAPDYASAHAGLAEAYRQQSISASSTERRQRVEAEVLKALELNPQESLALAIRGYLLYYTATAAPQDAELARQFWRKAIEANPSNSDALRWLAMSYYGTDPRSSMELLRRAYHVDPVRPITSFLLSTVLKNFGRFDEAMTVAADYHHMRPDDWQAYFWATRVLAFQGRGQDALKVYYRAFQLDQDSMPYNMLLWHLIDHLSADQDLMAAWLEYWKTRAGNGYDNPGTDVGAEIAFYIVSGQSDEAVHLINQYLDSSRIQPQFAAYFTLRAVGDYRRVRDLYDLAYSQQGMNPAHPDFSDMRWDMYTDYALALKHTGEPHKAQVLAEKILAHVEFLLGDGMLFGPGDQQLYFHQAMLAVVMDRPESAITALRRAADTGYHVCGPCLLVFPHFDDLRGVPEFEAIVAEIEAQNAAAIRRLSDEGLLLTPEELLALEQFEFDPFAE